MPAFYAHDRFGARAASGLETELKGIVRTYYKQFKIGLQGPDIFFFYQPYHTNAVSEYGSFLHHTPARRLFEYGLDVVRKEGRNSGVYAYILGVICHYVLDSQCHPYVGEMVRKSKVTHREIEEEFEKKLLYLEGENPFAFPIARLVPVDDVTVSCIAPLYEGIEPGAVYQSLIWLRLIKRLCTIPGRRRQDFVNWLMKITGTYDAYKGMINQMEENEACQESSRGLTLRFHRAISLARELMEQFDACVQNGGSLDEQFNRTFS